MNAILSSATTFNTAFLNICIKWLLIKYNYKYKKIELIITSTTILLLLLPYDLLNIIITNEKDMPYNQSSSENNFIT